MWMYVCIFLRYKVELKSKKKRLHSMIFWIEFTIEKQIKERPIWFVFTYERERNKDNIELVQII